ncbi:putative oxidoreductase [Psilocybe cubensis]|uniref:D-xylose 1-dehydrogenase (NADP(+), D-xylono-1,5-lactone-forming) n=2 Tax=Psilocybe cubensis TaxID=181762 RepID=A0A8H8CLT4_PSICU|nr:putative oxidoreductase [Psilocybe cubensis]KAH9481039.1 putative oxidoreductase [Psilocybe cubensis]
MSSFIASIKRAATSFNPPTLPNDNNPLKFGIISTADISVQALILPARSHPSVEVYAIAGRNPENTEKFAKKHSIRKVYSGKDAYQALVEDPEIDVVYIPLPNIMHYEWTMRSLNAGKHVLVEKPIAMRAEEARRAHELAETKGLVLMEAMHVRFHPAVARLREIIERGDIGSIKHISSTTFLPSLAGALYTDDKFALGKGCMMDVGCYAIEMIRLVSSSVPISVTSAEYDTDVHHVHNMDDNVRGTLQLPNGVTADFASKISVPPRFGIIPKLDFGVEVVGEKGTAKLNQYMFPHLYHSIVVTDLSGKKTIHKAYTFSDGDGTRPAGEPWWSTFRYQLEAFVTRIKGNKPRIWMSKEDSVAVMQAIEQTYEKMGMEARPKSPYV